MDKNNLELAIQLRHELHEHPELSYEEIWTREYLKEFIRKHTSLKIVDKGRWFYAVYEAGNDNPGIAFRAEFDALPIDDICDLPYASKIPGKGHKCGHDGHSASLAGLALELEKYGADRNIYLLFQHAEETGQGAIECAPLIAENNIEEIYAFHNTSGYPKHTVAVKKGTMHCASKGMTITMEGKSAHAGMPETGINPSFAIASIINVIPELIRPENSKGMVLCTIIQVDIGELAFGTAAGHGKLRLTIRGQYEDEMNKLQHDLEEISLKEAEKWGLKCSFDYQDAFPETVNHSESVDKVIDACKTLNLPVINMEEPRRTSEDFGHLLKLTKGAMFRISYGENLPPLHDAEYDFDDDLIEEAVEIFKELIKS
ncbi:amidohydrolase [Paratissierella segnis]|jgi:amidohydrolase|uniref:Amidohydrolase n=1 Tax=Paratissierella segnis TaxID=2763679 RepID=A0A926IIK3_9FIRM|nr:amidohydrolase [Paratissierella segnis]MBC8587054.1 amidohydrolase [Paratissierella segnis]